MKFQFIETSVKDNTNVQNLFVDLAE